MKHGFRIFLLICENLCQSVIPPGKVELMKTTLVILALGAASTFAADQEEKLKPGLDAITPDGMLAHIKTLASDDFEGRAPGSKGEELSIKYIEDQFKRIGLAPGN